MGSLEVLLPHPFKSDYYLARWWLGKHKTQEIHRTGGENAALSRYTMSLVSRLEWELGAALFSVTFRRQSGVERGRRPRASGSQGENGASESHLF